MTEIAILLTFPWAALGLVTFVFVPHLPYEFGWQDITTWFDKTVEINTVLIKCCGMHII